MKEGRRMKTLKLLFITKDHSQQLERSSYYLTQELKKHVNLTVWSQHGHILDILNKLPVKPDFILLNDYKNDYRPIIKGLEQLTTPHGIIMHDMHYKKSKREILLQKENPSLIFSHYRDAFFKWFPNHKGKFVWFPHHVPEHLFKDYRLPKSINLLMAGAVFPHLYPFRSLLLSHFKNDPRFFYIPHPGYRKIKSTSRGSFAGESYAKVLNQAKIFLTCDSIHKFPLLKYFETLACNTLLLAPASRELTDLGFVDGETFVAVNENNFSAKAEHFLMNETARNRIALSGYKMIKKRHTTAVRVQEMVSTISKFLKSKENGM
jgi:hypothetical protein